MTIAEARMFAKLLLIRIDESNISNNNFTKTVTNDDINNDAESEVIEAELETDNSPETEVAEEAKE